MRATAIAHFSIRANIISTLCKNIYEIVYNIKTYNMLNTNYNWFTFAAQDQEGRSKKGCSETVITGSSLTEFRFTHSLS